jgi:hypothetical protein
MLVNLVLNAMFSEKATNFWKYPLSICLKYVVMVKSIVEIWQNFVAFSEYIKFNEFNLAKPGQISDSLSLKEPNAGLKGLFY